TQKSSPVRRTKSANIKESSSGGFCNRLLGHVPSFRKRKERRKKTRNLVQDVIVRTDKLVARLIPPKGGESAWGTMIA
ncbi:hypothetical protein IscW_ISCW005614, partial [Ixodes scapularis]